MAIVQTEAQLVAIANESAAMYDERAEDIKALEATVTNLASLKAVCNVIGYNDAVAEYLVDGGVTFA